MTSLTEGDPDNEARDKEGFWDDKLHLVGHCAICLTTITGPGFGSRRDLEEMDHIWPYLQTEWKEEYVSNYVFLVEKARRKDSGGLQDSQVPPLCAMCRDSLKILDKLHHEMVTIKKKIETQASAIKRMMTSGKFEKGLLKFMRDLKKAQLPGQCVSNTVEFVSHLHGRDAEELANLLASISLDENTEECSKQEHPSKSEDGRKASRQKKVRKRESSMDLFADDSMEVCNVSTSASVSCSDIPSEAMTSSNNVEAKLLNVSSVKAEPQSDLDDSFDSNELMDMDLSVESENDDDEDFSIGKQSAKSKGSRKSTPKSKSRKSCTKPRARKRRLESEEPPVKVKKEVQSDKEFVSNEEDDNSDSDSDWNEDLDETTKRSPKTAKKAAKPEESELKYRTHSRKKCEVCMEKLPLSVLFEHLQSHVKDYAVKCSNCGQSFMSKHRLEVYHYQKWPKCRQAAGLPPPPWTKKCESCDFTADSHVSMRCHLQKHEIPMEKNYTCPFINCGQSFTLRVNVEFHLEKHYNQGSSSAATQRCPICAKCIEYNAEIDMKTHLKKAHKLNEVFPCKGCPQVYHDREVLIKHIFRTHHKEGIHCDICTDDDVKYFKENQLREHYLTAHSVGMKHNCNICDYVGFTEKQLQKHKWYKHKNGELSTPLPSFRCEICTETVYEYKSKDALTTHNIKFHGAEPFSCKFCGETFETKNRWWYHERKHLGPIDPRYKCEYCQKRFNVAGKLKDHIDRVHLKLFVNTFKCDQCDKSYSDICGLRYHKSAVHLGIKYTCEECGQGFAAPGALKNHQRRHTGERPYKCHLCPNSFRQPDAYKRHLFCHETLGDKFKPKKTNDRKFKTNEETVEEVEETAS